jgi:hypothetical protein
MQTKEGILKKIEDAGKEGITLTKLSGTSKRNLQKETKGLLEELEQEGKIEKKGSRYLIKGAKKEKGVRGNFVTKEEIEKLLGHFASQIVELHEKIDRVYEYVDEVFLTLRKEGEKKNKAPSVEEIRLIYDNINTTRNYGDSVPIPVFKEEIKKRYAVSNEEVDKILLELDRREIIYLQTVNNPEELKDKEKGIPSGERGLLYYITWIKRF